MSIAFWISPMGIYHEVEQTHIKFIIDNPDLFNMTIDQIKAAYETYNEPLGIEGKAREEIIRKVIREQGWIRTRHYLKPVDHWSFQCRDFKEEKPVIIGFCKHVIDKGLMNLSDSVKISDSKTELKFDWRNGGIKNLID